MAEEEEKKDTTPFVCINASGSSDEFTEMSLDKSSKKWLIRKEGKRLWIKCSNQASIKYPFQANKFKENATDGTVVFNVDGVLQSTIELVDEFVFNEFNKSYKGKVVNNVMMTEKTVRDMFRPSMYNGTLRVSVAPESCVIFSKDRGLVKDVNLADTLKEDLSVSLVIEPAFAWVMNGKIGIHWDATQIKINGSLSSVNAFKGNKPSIFSSPSSKPKPVAPDAFLLSMRKDSDSDEAPSKPVEKKILEKKVDVKSKSTTDGVKKKKLKKKLQKKMELEFGMRPDSSDSE
jgi:Fe-S cluster assembly iron-binding protein IscA